ncbi:SRPBCC family protein [Actinomadura harenae]|uniref:Polyketide cyclase n=1 Tax=Actinomadura harenae TaxID=2483351 RepID=A0A3M2MD45_9ACTN|nr:SRPBCC family protein [Actinomadura harenae]RMI45108.1 polyketide cyclase [Actinomadura harenae]
MSEVLHSTFVLERRYAASPATVFAAWADPEAKARWFAGPDAEHELDFRVGGREVNRGRRDAGPMLTFEAWYRDIVPDERIVYTSTLSAGTELATVSLTTVEFTPEEDGTRLLLTEQGTFLDGREEPSWREQGTGDWLDALATDLSRAAR